MRAALTLFALVCASAASAGSPYSPSAGQNAPTTAYADDRSAASRLNFELDGIAVAHEAIGEATVPEPRAISLLGLSLAGALGARGRSARQRWAHAARPRDRRSEPTDKSARRSL